MVGALLFIEVEQGHDRQDSHVVQSYQEHVTPVTRFFDVGNFWMMAISCAIARGDSPQVRYVTYSHHVCIGLNTSGVTLKGERCSCHPRGEGLAWSGAIMALLEFCKSQNISNLSEG